MACARLPAAVPSGNVPMTASIGCLPAEAPDDKSLQVEPGAMLLFCPSCGNGLIVEEGQRCHRFACNTCPYVHNITRKVTNRKYPKLKEVDDVLGGAAAWENVDSTAVLVFTPHECIVSMMSFVVVAG
ncbi:DNA-directed RNA polymerase III subunit RPC10 [Onychomys torridus]|uniref:DNA-directed RNA polymerase III subunit RPC10 n=1 Tax=Onychomys torridus TaxID=38674 RepID=UPI00167F31F1|nr:DNA-directed RNA polymerase III subunit RPC10 [Onychomys torridus]